MVFLWFSSGFPMVFPKCHAETWGKPPVENALGDLGYYFLTADHGGGID